MYELFLPSCITAGSENDRTEAASSQKQYNPGNELYCDQRRTSHPSLYQDEDTHVPIYMGNGSGGLAWTVQILEGIWVLWDSPYQTRPSPDEQLVSNLICIVLVPIMPSL